MKITHVHKQLNKEDVVCVYIYIYIKHTHTHTHTHTYTMDITWDLLLLEASLLQLINEQLKGMSGVGFALKSS